MGDMAGTASRRISPVVIPIPTAPARFAIRISSAGSKAIRDGLPGTFHALAGECGKRFGGNQ